MVLNKIFTLSCSLSQGFINCFLTPIENQLHLLTFLVPSSFPLPAISSLCVLGLLHQQNQSYRTKDMFTTPAQYKYLFELHAWHGTILCTSMALFKRLTELYRHLLQQCLNLFTMQGHITFISTLNTYEAQTTPHAQIKVSPTSNVVALTSSNLFACVVADPASQLLV